MYTLSLSKGDAIQKFSKIPADSAGVFIHPIFSRAPLALAGSTSIAQTRSLFHP